MSVGRRSLATHVGYGDRLPDAGARGMPVDAAEGGRRADRGSLYKVCCARPCIQANLQVLRRVEGGRLHHSLRVSAPLLDYTMHTRQRSYYQYALLHMAIMQADFCCYSEAAAAMMRPLRRRERYQDWRA